MARQTYTWNDITLTPESTAQALYSAGLRDPTMMAALVAVAKRESGYRAGVHGSDSPRERISGDRGLFQINGVHDDNLIRSGIIRSREDLFDPVINARAALHLIGIQGGAPSNAQWNAFGQLWGAGPGGWQPGGDPFYGTNRDAAINVVNNLMSTGQLQAGYQGPGYVAGQGVVPASGAPPIAGTPAPSAAAGPGANPGSADLGLVNAYGQNQRDYYAQQAGYNTNIFNLGQDAFNLQYDELEANKLFQQAIQGIYEDVNKAQGVFNTREFNEIKRNVAALRTLADRGLTNSREYYKIQLDIEKKTRAATQKWIGEQRGLTQRQYHQSVDEAGLVRGEQRRTALSEATAKGATTSRGFGQQRQAFDTQYDLAENQADITRDLGTGRLANDEQNAWLQYLAGTAGAKNQYQNQALQYQGQQEQFKNTLNQGSLRYDQTAKQLWAKARELAEQKTLNDKMVGIQYKGIGNQRDVSYQQYQQSHHSLQNQHTQVGMNQLRDIQQLNQQRQDAATQALLSLSPYG